MTVAERHPLNTVFSWEPRRTTPRFLDASQFKSYDELGFFVVEQAFDPSVVAEVVGHIDPIEREFEERLRGVGGTEFIARADEITFTTHLVARSPHLRDFVSCPPLTDICADLIGPDVRLYWDQAVYKKPGTEASFPWHQDNGYAFVEPQQYLTCWIALTDATEENGCPWVVPGLHLGGTLRHRATPTGLICFESVEGAIPVPVEAGGIVVFSSLTPHCTGPNRSTQVRKAYIVQYAPDGAYVVQPGPDGALCHMPADDARRQFEVLVGGLVPGPIAAGSEVGES
ncbi:MAG TPA: phytanoyl-CoA dioxygenase family protein [Acidimicrobiales bacterium]